MRTKVIHHGCGCSTVFILIIAICLLNTCSDLNKANAKNDALDQRVQKLEKKLKDAEWQIGDMQWKAAREKVDQRHAEKPLDTKTK